MKSLLLLDQRGKEFSKSEKILYYLLGALFISFFLPDMPVVGNIVMGALILHSFFYNSWKEKGQLLRKRWGVFLMFLFFLLHIVSAVISANREEGLEMLVLRLPLLVFPISIGLIYIREELKDRLLLLFAVITTLMAICCCVYSIQRSIHMKESAFMYDDSLTDLIARQSIYIAQVVNLALFSYIYLLTKKSFTIKLRWLVWLSILFLLIFHFLLASRIGIITLYSSMLIYAIYSIISRKKYLEGATLVLGLLIGSVLLIKAFPKTLNRFRELNYTNYDFKSHAIESHYNMKVTADQWNGANIRLAVWKCGWELFKEHPLNGVPLGDKEDKLVEVFKSKNFDFAATSRRNMHNGYLDILVNFGIIGFGIFLLAYIGLPLIGCAKAKDGLGAFIILSIAAALLTETYPDQSFGCIVLGFFPCLVSAWEKS